MVSARPNSTEKRIAVRVKTGCKTCRVRRVKCDEGRPSCLKCSSTGRTCDGYDKPAQPSNHPAALLATRFYSIPFTIPGSQEERQIFHYYYNHAANSLAGLAVNSNHFWFDTVIKRSCDNNLIRNSMLSLAWMHRDCVDGKPPSDSSLKAYNRAIRQFRHYLATNEKQDRETILVCCALLHSYEMLRGNYDLACMHLNSGLRLIDHGKCPTLTTSIENYKAIYDLYMRHDMNLTLYNDSRPLSFPSVATYHCSESIMNLKSFSSLQDAQTSLMLLQNQLMHFLTRAAPWKTNFTSYNVGSTDEPKQTGIVREFSSQRFTGSSQRDQSGQHERANPLISRQFSEAPYLPDMLFNELLALHRQFELWGVAFETLLASDEDARDARAIPYLRLLFQLFSCLLEQDFPLNNVSPDEIRARFQAVFQTIEKIHLETSKDKLPSISCELGVLAPTFLIILKCNKHDVRNRAIKLLKELPRREGLIDGMQLVELAENMMDMKRCDMPFPRDQDIITVEDWASDLLNCEGGLDDLMASFQSVL